jgi:hypothetical protein
VVKKRKRQGSNAQTKKKERELTRQKRKVVLTTFSLKVH